MKELKVNVLRGEDAIGENLIEVSTTSHNILLECGEALSPTEETKRLENIIRRTEYDGIVITHSHIDHSGLLRYPLSAKQIYLGEGTYKILMIGSKICNENLSKITIFKNCDPFTIGEMTVTPYLCDHSAYDSYMIEITNKSERILYTGDFRSNGRKSFDKLLSLLPKSVDLLLCEGTSTAQKHLTERQLENKMVSLFQKYDRVFALFSTENMDRTVTFYRSAKRSGKKYIQHMETAKIAKELPNIPNPISHSDCFTFLPKKKDDEIHTQIATIYREKLLGRRTITEKGNFVMQITSSMGEYLKKMNEIFPLHGSLCVYSLWEGYKENENFSIFLQTLNELGIETVSLHTSGHADKGAIRRLIDTVHPKETIFVHTNQKEKKQ